MAKIVTNDKREHPLIAMRNLIDKKGLAVFNPINGLPLHGDPYVSDYFTIALNLQGHVKAEYDMRPLHFSPQDISIQPPGHILRATEVEEDYRAILVAISPDFMEEMKYLNNSVYVELRSYHWEPDTHLTDEQFKAVRTQLELMGTIADSSTPRRREILKNMLAALTLLMQDFRDKGGFGTLTPSPREELFSRFYQAIADHHHESHEVGFYANMFCLSPKHFAAVIKQQTGTSASEWIRNYILVQAKSLLQYHPELTIKQVSTQLGFPDQASFSRFFRTYAGMSPSECRDRRIEPNL